MTEEHPPEPLWTDAQLDELDAEITDLMWSARDLNDVINAKVLQLRTERDRREKGNVHQFRPRPGNKTGDGK